MKNIDVHFSDSIIHDIYHYSLKNMIDSIAIYDVASRIYDVLHGADEALIIVAVGGFVRNVLYGEYKDYYSAYHYDFY